jgi:hypothetical protein
MTRPILLMALFLYAASGLAASTKTKAAPSPRPVVKRQRVVIRPRPLASKEPSRFEIVRATGKANEIEIHYVSQDPTLTLDAQSSIVIQLNTPPSLVIEPSVITSSEWPKGATRMNLKFKGALSAGTWIDGAAAYTVCKARKCRQAQSAIRADFR